ncbi:hypothetical protein [Paraburkholderia caledonica]|uniref:hypothetical protein n=1 Tax=Paraburkholderia caledonica TaxID=134536 RepID=UPI0004838F14|nr:hypothetical protein [Paraburkholderia caledonica]
MKEPYAKNAEVRRFEICVDLVARSEDRFDAWLRIEGPPDAPAVAKPGRRIKVRGGTLCHRWAYFVAQIAGLAAIDVILGPGELFDALTRDE